MINQFPLKTWVKKFAYSIGGQGRVKFAKKAQQHPPIVTSFPENPKPKTEQFASVGARGIAESAGGSNTFLALSTGDFWRK